jgi:Arc/MetJ-type ribon-helix-helix transcriptional regulator
MGKINISLPDGLLEEIDKRAGDSGANRSAFMREAAKRYLCALDEEAEQAARSKRLGKAMTKMRSLAPLVGAPGSANVIRERRDSAPRWEKS